MQNNDVRSRSDIRAAMQQALRDNNTDAFYNALDEMMSAIERDVRRDYDEARQQQEGAQDARVLNARGVRQLTTAERGYYQKLAGAMRAPDPRQALANLDVVMPRTVIDAVFDELQTRHPLLSHLNFRPSGGAAELVVNTNGMQAAAWGELCDEIVKELTGGFAKINASLLKLTAFLLVCKAMLDLGPEWLDSFVRQTLYEALANGLEAGFVDGDGNKKPIGMTRRVGAGVSVTDGMYPRKTAVKVDDLGPATLGNLISILAADPNGKPRQVRDVILLVNPQDYFQRIMPATTIMTPDGTYRNDVLSYPMTVIQTPALKRGEAVMGLAYRYLALAGMSTEGRIEYSDHYRFLEDERVYLIKAYANGLPLDDNAFLLLDISGLRAATYRVTVEEEAAPSSDANLADLKIGALALTPAFAAATTAYTAATTNATNTITAVPANAGATLDIDVGGTSIDNGSAATWASGANTVTITVTAPDGSTTKTYTVTVTKS